MKRLVEPRTFKSRGASKQMHYEVVSNAKMMRLLSDSLYSDKIAAPVRELSTNAWDAHIVAGHQRPFDVTLPTRQDPTFRIRDYGCSLAPEQVREMYRKYGASDKTETNDLQGCMGLGSKSPFAYCDQFTSIAYYNGKKYIWVNSKDDRDIPRISLLLEEPTDEPDGFEVSFSVKTSDVEAFQEAAERVYRPFPVKPNVSGSSRFKPLEYEFVLEADDKSWGVRSGQDTRWNSRNSYVVMGHVEYPIEPQHFNDIGVTNDDKPLRGQPSWYRSSGRSVNSRYVRLLNMGLVLRMEIGAVEMDISREGLQYHKLTIDAIRNVLDKVLAEISAKVSEKFDKCANLWEARCLYHQLKRSDFANIDDLCGLAGVKYNGVELDTTVPISRNFNIGFKAFSKSGYASTKVRRSDFPSSVQAGEKVGFFLNDVDKGAYAAAMRAVDGGLYEIVYLFKEEDGGDTIETVAKAIGIPDSEIVRVSKLPKPKPKKRTKVSKPKVFKLKAEGRNTYYDSYPNQWWEDAEVDMSAGGVYVEVSRHHPVNSKVASRVNHFARAWQLSKECGLTPPVVYGVKTISIKKFRDASNWQTFDEWLDNALTKHLAANGLGAALASVQGFSELSDHDLFEEIERIKNPKKVATSDLYTFLRDVKVARTNFQKNKDKVNNLRDLVRMASMEDKLPKCKSLGSLKTREKDIMEKYGMLDFVSIWDIRRDSNKKQVIDYINLVDSI